MPTSSSDNCSEEDSSSYRNKKNRKKSRKPKGEDEETKDNKHTIKINRSESKTSTLVKKDERRKKKRHETSKTMKNVSATSEEEMMLKNVLLKENKSTQTVKVQILSVEPIEEPQDIIIESSDTEKEMEEKSEKEYKKQKNLSSKKEKLSKNTSIKSISSSDELSEEKIEMNTLSENKEKKEDKSGHPKKKERQKTKEGSDETSSGRRREGKTEIGKSVGGKNEKKVNKNEYIHEEDSDERSSESENDRRISKKKNREERGKEKSVKEKDTLPENTEDDQTTEKGVKSKESVSPEELSKQSSSHGVIYLRNHFEEKNNELKESMNKSQLKKNLDVENKVQKFGKQKGSVGISSNESTDSKEDCIEIKGNSCKVLVESESFTSLDEEVTLLETQERNNQSAVVEGTKKKLGEMNNEKGNESTWTNEGRKSLKKKAENLLNIKGNKPKTLNILLLGQTGVGKSTFINGVSNYLLFKSFEEAEEYGPVHAVSTTFTVTTDDYDSIKVTTGQPNDKTELDEIGESQTKGCKTYQIEKGQFKINIIDTPGIGDTKGFEQDKENIEMILDHISYVEKLHGIWILLKPNESRITTLFKFCLQTLLSFLHKKAEKNIIFCFMSARSTHFKPGNTFESLASLLNDMALKISEDDRTFCFDNESYRYLSSRKLTKVSYTKEEREKFRFSWIKSSNELDRLLMELNKIKSHMTEYTISINKARRIVLTFSEILAKTRINMEQNKINLKKSNDNIKMLSMCSALPEVYILCSNKSCKQSRCNVEQSTLQNIPSTGKVFLKPYSKKKCKHCSCTFSKHFIHRLFENEEVTLNKKDLVSTKKYIEDLNEESQIITEELVKYQRFLNKYSIISSNEALEDYLELLIELEQQKNKAGEPNNETLESTKKVYEEYKLALSKQSANTGKKVKAEDIIKSVEKLYKLKINGKDIETAVTTISQHRKDLSKRNYIKVERS